jgi:hypothetical protein
MSAQRLCLHNRILHWINILSYTRESRCIIRASFGRD